MDIPEIGILTSDNQSFVTDYIYLGLDTEMLIQKNNKILWPDSQQLPQEREPLSLKTGYGDNTFDFHGDGFATELCVAPTYCLEILMGSVTRGFQWWMAKHKSSPTTSVYMNFKAPSVYIVPKNVIDKASDTAKQLGCMPSLNAYGDAGNPKGLEPFKRTTGCHLHLSHPTLANSKNTNLAQNLVQWADILIGATWTYISPEDPNVESERRKYYGRAGEHRLKIYPVYPQSTMSAQYSAGVEYRVLPGLVLQHPVYFTLMFSLYRSALITAYNCGAPDTDLNQLAVNAVNSADKTLAGEVISKIPFSSGSQDLIKTLHKTTLKANMKQWNDLGHRREGHQHFAATNYEVSNA